MDVVKRELIKNAAREKGADYDDIEAHMIKGYADKYKLFLESAGAEIPEALLLSKEEVKEGDEALLHGPQLEGQGISQDDIDALFDWGSFLFFYSAIWDKAMGLAGQ